MNEKQKRVKDKPYSPIQLLLIVFIALAATIFAPIIGKLPFGENNQPIACLLVLARSFYDCYENITTTELVSATATPSPEFIYLNIPQNSAYNLNQISVPQGLGRVNLVNNIGFHIPRQDAVTAMIVTDGCNGTNAQGRIERFSQSRFVIDVNQNDIKRVHFLMIGGNGFYYPADIGTIQFEWQNGETDSVTLTLGVNIRDWSMDYVGSVHVINDPHVARAQGVGGIGTLGQEARMDVLSYELDSTLQNTVLERIIIEDTTTRNLRGDADPCIIIWAVTLER